MSRTKKVLIILHLCFAFTFLCWLLIQPYVKEILSAKSELALYEMVHERSEMFEELPASDKRMLLEGYQSALQRQAPSMLSEMGRIFSTTPPFALAWLFFSVVVSLLLLFHIEGSAQAAWLLPMIVVGYAYFLYIAPPPAKPSLFPKEMYVWETYVSPQEKDSLSRRDALLAGWHRYLVSEWAHETPSTEKELFATQVDKGLFAFNVARLKWTLAGRGDEVIMAGFSAPPSQLRLACYLIWNLIFAWMMTKKEKQPVCRAPSAASS